MAHVQPVRDAGAAAPLHGATLILTRSAGTARTEARRVQALGGKPLPLPGTRLAPPADADAARTALQAALRASVCIFVSPAAVRAAARLLPLRQNRGSRMLAVGAATARALARCGLRDAQVPARADSEGLLAMPALNPPPPRVGLVGAPGGRSLLPDTLAGRGAQVLRAEVYRRQPPRLDRRHRTALARARMPLYVLLSSGEALQNLLHALPEAARTRLLAACAIASSTRLAQAARTAGFARVETAASALTDAMIAAAVRVHRADRRRHG